jgi:hypothetical protein
VARAVMLSGPVKKADDTISSEGSHHDADWV